jgi:pilus assembly protein Flp/PilA
MQRISKFARAFAKNESGATAIEYGLICSLIFVVIIASVTAVADSTVAMYELISAAMQGS